ncbi:Slowpoke-binding protein [Halotydeus destructor]|nr:Slowpoke-binding protein [Halotydeus destructor]
MVSVINCCVNIFASRTSTDSNSDPSESFVFGMLSADWSTSGLDGNKENVPNGGHFGLVNCTKTLRLWDTYMAYYPDRTFNLERALSLDPRDSRSYLIIMDKQTRTKRLAIIDSLTNETPSNIEAANELLGELRHTYILPILYLDIFAGQLATIVVPLTTEGTLAQLVQNMRQQVDLCSQATPTSTMVRSSFMSTSLIAPITGSLVNLYSIHERQVRTLARQVLEAIVFLHDRGFRPFGQFCSGDVMIQNGTARLSGVERVLLRTKGPNKCPMMDEFEVRHARSIDTICFGHLFWELINGLKLDTLRPSSSHLTVFQPWPILVETLQKIFAMEERYEQSNHHKYPQIEEIMTYKIFAVDLREMPADYNRVFVATKLSPEAEQLAQQIGLKRQMDPRLRKRSSFELFFTPPTTPSMFRKATPVKHSDSYDFPEFGSSRIKKKASNQVKTNVDHRGRLKTQMNAYGDIRVFAKFRRPP